MSTTARNPSYDPSPGHAVTQLRFEAGRALNEHLRELYKPEALEQLAGLQGLFLYSDDVVHSERSSAESLMHGASSRTPAEIAAMQRNLRNQEHRLRPLAKRLQVGSREGPGGGVVLKMDVILDGLTAAAVRGLMVIQPDNSIGTHHHIPHNKHTSRPEYLAACRRLYERLLDEEAVPLQVSSVEVVENPFAR